MHEEIDYAEMLEIPVSTVNVIKKPSRRKKTKTTNPSFHNPSAPFTQNEKFTQNVLRDSVIAQVNDKLSDEQEQSFISDYAQENDIATPLEITADAELFAESANSDGRLDFDPIPERIDTVRLYSEDNKRSLWDRFRLRARDFSLSPREENEGGRYATKYKIEPSKAIKITLDTEFALACALCGVIFLTNVFMPNSAFNTFFRSMNEGKSSTADARAYTDFTLSPVVSELSNAELNLSPTGVLSFTEEGCVYPGADGKIAAIEKSKDGTHRVKISYSDSFTGVINGLDYVYYAIGDEVKANVPLGYSDGEAEVQVTMYSEGVLLNCFELTEENCLAWLEEN
ncbi:MAG: hypothetical protein E7349_04580 [Clostridiales bacterium]|nr:hypothetical protein [Clostridiales bacterium]